MQLFHNSARLIMLVQVVTTAENTYSIAGKQLKLTTYEDVAEICKEIEQVKGLTTVDLSGNTIGIEALEALSKALLTHKDSIADVEFSDIYTGRLNTEIPQSLGHLLPALLQMTNLQKLNLSDNALGLQAIEPIESYLAQAVTLEHLILSNNGMGPFAGARIGTALFKLAQLKIKQGKPSLKTFVCGRNRLENGSIDRLAVGLRNHEDLEVVRLYQNGIRPAGIAKLIKHGLVKNRKIKVLDLQDNTLTPRALEALAEALPGWAMLSELNLNDCLLKAKGSLRLLESILHGEEKRELTHLKLQYNELDERSLRVLVKVINDKLPNLQTLELNGNTFDEEIEALEQINDIFDERGFGRLDELDDLEELDSDEEDDDEDDEGSSDKLPEDADLDEVERVLKGIDVSKEEQEVDELVGELEKTHIE